MRATRSRLVWVGQTKPAGRTKSAPSIIRSADFGCACICGYSWVGRSARPKRLPHDLPNRRKTTAPAVCTAGADQCPSTKASKGLRTRRSRPTGQLQAPNAAPPPALPPARTTASSSRSRARTRGRNRSTPGLRRARRIRRACTPSPTQGPSRSPSRRRSPRANQRQSCRSTGTDPSRASPSVITRGRPLGHRALHEFIEEGHCERRFAMRRAPDHAFLNQRVSGRTEALDLATQRPCDVA